MATPHTRLRGSRGGPLDLILFVTGLAVLGWALPGAAAGGWPVALGVLVAAPLVILIARFPLLLDDEDGGIEIGFESAVLVFLLCACDVRVALAIWGVSVAATQLTTASRRSARAFNIGLGILGGGIAALVLRVIGGGQTGTVREFVAVLAAAAAYFLIDYLLSIAALAIRGSTRMRIHLVRPGTWLAVACFVPFDLLGYLAALVWRSGPVWMLVLFAVPLIALLISTRAIARGRENTRRLAVLFEAAVRVQALHDADQIVDALLLDAKRLLRIPDVTVRDRGPGVEEIGARVRHGEDALWVIAPARDRARSTVGADQHALDALAVISAEAFARVRLTEEMAHYARHDLLTDLPNRAILLDRISHALPLARRRRALVALLFVDLDAFKPVNDRLGHEAGDAVLVEIAARLRASTRESDTVSRLGGDEFAILLEDVTPETAVEVADRVLAALSRGVEVAGTVVRVGGSIGIAYGDGSERADELLRNADLAMYQAKSRGKGQHVVYQPWVGAHRMERLELVEELRRAIVAREVQVVYQPVVATDTGVVVGVEALVRWRLHDRKVPTDVFIRIAEETGLVVPLGELVLETVAEDAALVRAAAGAQISLSVNVTVRQLRDPSYVDAVARAFAAMGRSGLVLEIIERQGVAEDPDILDAMGRIAASGVRFAIDDFGAGFSAISYLHDLPVSVVKVDAALARAIDTDERACALLRAVTSMAQALDLDVVVEGIERESQLAVVREEIRAPYVQGYLLHRPMARDALLDALRRAQNGGASRAGPDGELLSNR